MRYFSSSSDLTKLWRISGSSSTIKIFMGVVLECKISKQYGKDPGIIGIVLYNQVNAVSVYGHSHRVVIGLEGGSFLLYLIGQRLLIFKIRNVLQRDIGNVGKRVAGEECLMACNQNVVE